jgi:hypothetical protein
MRITKPVAGLALATSALTGLGAGALVLAPGAAVAQEQQAPDGQQQAPDGQDQGPRRGPHGPKLDAAAEAIGVSVDELRTALENDQTIAQVAQAHNVSVDTVIDAMVADAREHITALVNGQKPERPADAPQGDQQRPSDDNQDQPPASGS